MTIVNVSEKVDGRGGARRGAGRKKNTENSADTYQIFNEARAKKEVANAKIAEMEAKRIKGELLKRDDVLKEQAIVARMVRDTILAVPSRIAALLTHKSDEREIERLITSELKSAFRQIAQSGDSFEVD